MIGLETERRRQDCEQNSIGHNRPKEINAKNNIENSVEKILERIHNMSPFNTNETLTSEQNKNYKIKNIATTSDCEENSIVHNKVKEINTNDSVDNSVEKILYRIT